MRQPQAVPFRRINLELLLTDYAELLSTKITSRHVCDLYRCRIDGVVSYREIKHPKTEMSFFPFAVGDRNEKGSPL